jgi:hypothetical protein
MTDPATRLAADRAARDTARGLFDIRLAKLRGDLAERGIGGRIKDQIGSDAKHALGTALEIADSQKGVIAGTVAALALWLLRAPIIAWVSDLLPTEDEETDSE